MKKIAAALVLAIFLALGSGCTTAITKDSGGAKVQENAIYEREGFVTQLEDGRIWVFLPESKELKQFEKNGELAKHIVRPGAGPGRMTVKAPDAETLDAYLLARPGYITRMKDGRLWVFKSDTKEFQHFIEQGEPAKHIVRPGAGPNGMTVKATDVETLDGYLATVKK